MKEPASNTEWIAWGKYDPLYGVSSYAERHKDGSKPWTEEEFYAFGAEVWPHLKRVWSNYGMPDGICVEIGCGAGRITKQLASDFRKVHAFDVSEEMLNIAKLNISGENVTFHLSGGQAIDLPEASVDAAFSTDVFQHFSNGSVAYRYFAELGKVLKPGGTLMIHLPVYKWPSNDTFFSSVYAILRRIEAAKYRLKRTAVKFGMMDPFMLGYRYEITQLYDCLVTHGFEDIEFRILAPPISRKKHKLKPFILATRDTTVR